MSITEESRGNRVASLDAAELVDIVQRIAADDPLSFVSSGTVRRWTLVEDSPAHQAWIIAWPPGAGLGLHDHDGSQAAICIVAGELRERYIGDGELTARWLGENTTVQLPGDHVHEVINVGTVEAVSVHAYSPPILDMSFRTDPTIDMAHCAGPNQRPTSSSSSSASQY